MGIGAFFLGIAVLGLGLWAVKAFVDANPGKLAERMVLGGTFGALGLGAVLVLTGRGAIGFPLVALGFTLWSRRAAWKRATPRPGGASRVRTQLLEMVLDLDTGAVSGRVIAGRHAGRALKDITEAELIALWDESATDPDSRALLETYLDRRAPRWREHRQADAEPGGLGAAGQGPMGPDEAYEILGLQAGAGPEEVRRAYRSLMKKLHPDQGGSSYLAARVNQAKDVLLHRHR